MQCTPEVSGTLRSLKCWYSAVLTLLNIHLVCFRCSDGMDRHRQEWLDYACSEEVMLDIMSEYLLICHFLRLTHLLHCTRAEQRCKVWGLLQGRQLHWFLHHTGERRRDLFDSSTKRLSEWWWGWAVFCISIMCEEFHHNDTFCCPIKIDSAMKYVWKWLLYVFQMRPNVTYLRLAMVS